MEKPSSVFLYDTARRSVQPIEPITPGVITMYTCGPTVYFDAHIGNLRTYIAEDILTRTLMTAGYEVNRVMNITDVGHLVSDGDEGEDKLEVGAKRDGITAWEVAKRYEERFLADFEAVGCEIPTVIRATDTIAEQIALVQKLESLGHTYQAADGIYFSAETFAHYGEMAKLDLEGQQAGARVALVEGKRSPHDFALWKFSPAGVTRDMQWESPWGMGFPGWHIECSAIALSSLGEQLDIHCGGVDHIPVHHTNEIAQSESVTGKQFARHWMHGEFLQVDGGKMSKSLGNGYTLADLRKKGVDPLSFRYFILQAGYRTKQNFTFEAVLASQTALQRLRAQVQALPDGAEAAENELQQALTPLYSDLGTPQLLAWLHEALKQPSTSLKSLIRQIDEKVLAVGLFDVEQEVDIPVEVASLAEERWAARLAKEWQKADELRAQIEALGFEVLDRAGGYEVKKG